MITLFEKFNNIPNVNFVSDNFWKMVDVADWNSVIEGYNNSPIINEKHRNFFRDAQLRLYSVYSLKELKDFYNEYDKIYYPLYNYFDDEKIKNLVSDDGYSDLVSSIIGKGKIFTENCIKNKKLIMGMAENNDFAENFEYLLMQSEKDYYYIKNEYPFEKEKNKYNL